VSIRTLTVDELLTAVAARTPAPGGGAVAPVVAALGAALGRMVVNYSLGKKTLAAHDALHRESLIALEQIAREVIELADEDARAYEKLNELQKLDPDDTRRREEWSDALQAAIDVPCRALATCQRLVATLTHLDGTTNRFLRSDLVLAAVLTEAAARASAVNVRINIPLLEQDAQAREIDDETQRQVQVIRQSVAHIESK
jgi:formiminotetrahydrofolate cyclodeaminase